MRSARLPAFVLVYTAAVFVTRYLVVQDAGGASPVSLVAPTAGVALLWVITSPTRRALVVDSLLSVVIIAVGLGLTGGTTVEVLLTALLPLQALIARGLLRRWVPQHWAGGGERGLHRPAELGRVFAALAVGALAFGIARTVAGELLIPQETIALALARMARQFSGMGTVGVLGIVLGGWLSEQRRGRVWTRPRAADVGFLAMSAAVGAAVLALGDRVQHGNTSSFLLTLVVVGIASRYNNLVTATSCGVISVAVVAMTVAGSGPVAEIAEPVVRAAVAQLFVVTLMIIGLVVSVSRREVIETVRSLRRSEGALAARAQELDLMLGELSDGVAIVEESGAIVHANGALRRLLTGRSQGTLDQDDAAAALRHMYRRDGRPVSPAERPTRRALAGEVVNGETYLVRRPDLSRDMVIGCNATLLPTEPGTPRRVVLVMRDLTAENDRRVALSTFAGTVAHDLNNPIAVVDGWAEALEEELEATSSDLSLASLPMVRHIRASALQMRELVSDLLDHAMAQDQTLHGEQVSLRTMVKHIVTSRRRPGNGWGSVHADDHLLDVWADRVLIRQVVENLVGNALKYVAPGVEAEVTVSSTHDGPDWVRVSVSDNGIGIAPDQRDKVFDTFHRVSEGASTYAGTGLGLSICKSIIERHGGRIWVTANPRGQGSVFVFCLPATEAAFRAGAVTT